MHYFFSWYSGAVWGNLLASVLWAVPAYLWGRYHLKKLHRRLDTHLAYQKRIHKAIIDARELRHGK